MTTRVHVVNLGGDAVVVDYADPETNIPPEHGKGKVLYSHESENFYVHPTQNLVISERPAAPLMDRAPKCGVKTE